MLLSIQCGKKSIEEMNRCLTRIVLVDNCCFLPQLSNGIPISSCYDNPHDDALILNVLKGYLKNLDCETDVRPFLTKSFNLVQAFDTGQHS